jgi:hypothetical protein
VVLVWYPFISHEKTKRREMVIWLKKVICEIVIYDSLTAFIYLKLDLCQAMIAPTQKTQ